LFDGSDLNLGSYDALKAKVLIIGRKIHSFVANDAGIEFLTTAGNEHLLDRSGLGTIRMLSYITDPTF